MMRGGAERSWPSLRILGRPNPSSHGYPPFSALPLTQSAYSVAGWLRERMRRRIGGGEGRGELQRHGLPSHPLHSSSISRSGLKSLSSSFIMQHLILSLSLSHSVAGFFLSASTHAYSIYSDHGWLCRPPSPLFSSSHVPIHLSALPSCR